LALLEIHVGVDKRAYFYFMLYVFISTIIESIVTLSSIFALSAAHKVIMYVSDYR